jgi:hypothetical protein
LTVAPLDWNAMSQVDGTINGRSLGGVIFVLFIVLGAVVISSDRGVSRIMQDIGDFISRFFV